MSVHDFLTGINPRLAWPGILVILLMAAAALVLRLIPARAGAPSWTRHALCVTGLLLGLLAAAQSIAAIAYLFYPRYIDWIEPTIAAAAWIGWRGGNFYPLAGGGDMAGIWYGPLLFEITGFMLWLLGPSIIASKVQGVAAFFVSALLSPKMLKRAGAASAEALMFTIVQCLLLAGFANQGSGFGLRTEPLLLLAAELGVLVALSIPGLGSAAMLGALMGIAADLKLQGLFFIFPVFCFFLAGAGGNLRRAQLFAAAGLAGLAALLLPFALPGASLARYVALVGTAQHQGLSRWVLQKNLVFLLMLWSPMLWLYAAFRPKLPEGLVWFCAAFVPSAAMVTLAASLPGGGPYNYLPFLPSLAWLLVRLRSLVREQAPGGIQRLGPITLAMMLAFLLGFAPALAIAWHPVLRQPRDMAQIKAAQAGIEAEMRAHPGRTLEVGPGPYHDLRVVPVFHGHPLPIDSETWSDLKTAGVPEENARRLIRACRADTWLLPAKEDLFRENMAPGLYSPGFVAEFRAHYRKDATGGVLDTWRCVRRG